MPPWAKAILSSETLPSWRYERLRFSFLDGKAPLKYGSWLEQAQKKSRLLVWLCLKSSARAHRAEPRTNSSSRESAASWRDEIFQKLSEKRFQVPRKETLLSAPTHGLAAVRNREPLPHSKSDRDSKLWAIAVGKRKLKVSLLRWEWKNSRMSVKGWPGPTGLFIMKAELGESRRAGMGCALLLAGRWSRGREQGSKKSRYYKGQRW